MDKRITAASVLVSVLLMFGCSREGELRGDIFIVTNGAANIKLGLVEVSAIAEKDMNNFLVNRSKVVDTEIARTQEEYDSIKAQFDEANGQYLQARKWAQEEESRNLSGGDFSWSDARRALDKATVLDEIRPKLDSAELAISYARSAAPWFEGMPKAIITASTDGDGKFSMKLPRSGKFAIVAHASRQVFSSKEEYYWIVWTSLDGEASKNVMLSNKNLLLGEDDIKAQLALFLEPIERD
jgi:hypothetical protein